METTSILLVFIVLGMVIAFSIGANDETFACIYGSKTLTLRELLILSTIFAVLGAVFFGRAVSETVGKNILYIKITTAIVITVLISTAFWLILSARLGIPISTTHTTIGVIVGLGIFLGGWDRGINWLIIIEMSIWWILSPIIGFIASFMAYKLIHKFIINKQNGFQDFQKSERIFSYILVITICLTALSRAGNECSKAIGIVVGIGDIEINLLLFLTGLSFAFGIVILGRYIIKSVSKITELMPSTAFAAEIPSTIILFIGTLRGIPLSGSHMLVASLVGIAKARHMPIEKRMWKILIVWILTFPVAAIMAIIFYLPISSFI